MTITNQEFKDLSDVARGRDCAFTALDSSGLTRAKLRAAFDAINTFWETNRATLKASMDTAAGTTLPAALAKKIGKAWMLWKLRGE